MVQYRETGNVKDDIAQLAQSPGLEWMGELAARDDVDWQAVQEVYAQWKESDSGVGGPGMQLVSLAMAVALSATGWGASFAGSFGLESVAMTVAMEAGFNALVMQAGMQVVGNGGDIGAALEALASIETVQMLATAMLTAGLSHEALEAFGNTQFAKNLDGLAKDLANNTVKAGVRTGVGTAVNGGDLGENLVANLHSAAVSTLGAELAQEIGAAYDGGKGDLDYVSHKIAHAALGGAMDLAMGGDGVSGAIGGAVGEITAEALANEIEESLDGKEITREQALRWKNAGVDISKLAAGLVAATVGADIDTAANAAENAAENNAFRSLLSLIAHLGREKHELTEEQKAEGGQMLILSMAAYGEEVDTGDYEEVSTDVLAGHDIKLMDPDGSGLEGKVFYNSKTNEVVVAFKGTDTDSVKDWQTNAAQAYGNIGEQYKAVAAQIDALNEYASSMGAELLATGHSLGGGLATALASSGHVEKAVVFNPSGLHANTAAAFGGDLEKANQSTTAYVSRGDLLNFAQQYNFELGTIPVGGILPDSVGEQRIIGEAGFHSIDGFKQPFGLE